MSTSDRKPFLPSKPEVRLIGSELLFVITHIAYHFVWLLPMMLLWLIPAGDRFPNVASRLFVFLFSTLVFSLMMKYKREIFRRLFGRFVPQQIFDTYHPQVTEPTSMKVAIEQNWHLVVVAALMIILVSGAVDFNESWAGRLESWGKYQWIGRLLEWFRTNSNTTRSLAWLYLIGSLGIYGFRIRRGWICETHVQR